MMRGIRVWVVTAMVVLAGVACDDPLEPTEWYLGTEVIDKGDGVIGLSVIVLRYHAVAPDGTAVFFECDRPVLDGNYLGIEVRTVSGRASIDVTPPAGEEVWVSFSLPGETGVTGGVRLPPPVEP